MVTVEHGVSVRPVGSVLCEDHLSALVQFQNHQVHLQLRHNSELPFPSVNTVLLEGARDIKMTASKLVSTVLIFVPFLFRKFF